VVREVRRAADRLYLVAHDPSTGSPCVGPRQMGFALAAAVLGELVLAGLIDLTGGVVRPTDRQPFVRRVWHHSLGLSIMEVCVESHRRVASGKADEPCLWCGVRGVEVFPDRMVWETRQLIVREQTDRPVVDWLTVLATDAAALVAQRLAADEWLVPEYRRSWLSGRVRRVWVPANVVEAEGSREALRRVGRGLDRYPGPDECLVAGLVDAVGLTRLVVAAVPDPPAAVRALSDAAARLDDPLRLLVAAAKAAADNAVMAHTG
jgi:hypothetical protein